MATQVCTKKRLLELIETLPDDCIVLFTQDLSGTQQYSKKTNEKKISFGFCATAYKTADGLGDILNKGHLFAVSAMPRELVSEDALKTSNL